MSAHALKKPVILIDGSSYFYRAFHALPALVNSKGEPTGAIYGVINMIRKLMTDYQPKYVAVVFDSKGKTFRHDIFPAYKANRPPMPDDLRVQIEPLFSVIEAMGIPLITFPGLEADDTIATLARQAEAQGHSVLISTGDKDLTQLVNDQITLINTMSDTQYDRCGVIDKFGVSPEQMMDYLSLIGDSVDNIPGVVKVGGKTAAKWLQTYGSLENIIAHSAELSGKLGENLRAAIPQFPLSQQLIALKTDLKLPYSLEDLQKQPPDVSRLLNLFTQLEFKTWLKELSPHTSQTLDSVTNYETILTREALKRWIQKLEQSSIWAFDTETTSLNTLEARLVGLSFSVAPNEAAYVPVGHDYLGAPEQLPCDEVLESLKPILNHPQKTIVGQNLKYDMSVLENYGFTINSPVYDTMLESYVLDSSSNRHDLDSLSLKHLSKKAISFEEIAGKGVKQLTFNQIALEQAAPYAAQDADFTLQIHHELLPKIKAHADLEKILQQIELPLVRVLQRMERTGVMIDSKKLQQQSHDLAIRIRSLEEKAFELAGSVFNLSSPKQLQEILYHQLKLPVLSKTPTGAYSTAEAVLQELAHDYPLPKLILEHRSLSKLKSTYTDTLPKQIQPKTGRVHTSYHQATTSTGRLSSTNPNLQNIPIRHEEGRRIRQAFIAPPGYQMVSADYSQIELRIMAELSQDPTLLNAFANNHDIHAATASEIFGVPLTSVTPEQRRHAKAINFGLIYGMSAFGLAQQIDVERHQAQAYMDQYFARYTGVKAYMDHIREVAFKQGYVETLFGRRLYIPDIRSSQLQRKRAAERAAINAPMQGSAADIIKLSMIELDRQCQEGTLKAKMIMQVHDELIFEVAESELIESMKKIQTGMTQVVQWSVPLMVHIHSGNNWDEAH